MWDVDSIYKVPRMLHEQGLDELVCDKLQHRHASRPTCRAGTSWSTRSSIREHEVTIAMVGKYVDLSDSYKSLNEALCHAGIHNARAGQDRVPRLRADRARRTSARSASFDAILVPGGFGKRGVEGKIAATSYARENKHAVPRHLPRHAARDDRVRAQRGGPGRRQQHRVRSRHAASGDRADHRVDRTATARSSGATRSPTSAARCAWARRAADVEPGTLAHAIYGDVVTERHRHRYEANNNYLDRSSQQAGLRDLGAHAAREADRDHRAAAGVRIRGSSACSSTPSSSRRRGRPSAVQRRSSRPRSRTRPQRARRRRMKVAA